MLKKVVIMVSLVMVLMLGVIVNVKAETVSQKMLDNRIRHEISELESDISDSLCDSEARVRAIDFSVDYEDLKDGIYNICVKFVFYTKYEYEYHFVYDAYDDYNIAEYGVRNGVRMESTDLSKYIEDKFPGLW